MPHMLSFGLLFIVLSFHRILLLLYLNQLFVLCFVLTCSIFASIALNRCLNLLNPLVGEVFFYFALKSTA